MRQFIDRHCPWPNRQFVRAKRASGVESSYSSQIIYFVDNTHAHATMAAQLGPIAIQPGVLPCDPYALA
jgi:hypothetical protein